MSFADKGTPVSKGELGLDRTLINTNDQVQLVSEQPDKKFESNGGPGFIEHHGDHPGQAEGGLSKRKRLSIKAKTILHIGSDSTASSATAPVLADAPDAISDSRLVYEAPIKDSHTLSDVLHNPIDTIKSKSAHQAASNVVAKEISHGKDVELVQAHDQIQQARTQREKLLAIHNKDELMKARQDMFVRWTMDRHVTKVRILKEPTEPMKSRSEFVVKLPDGRARTDWAAYLTHIADYYAKRYGGEYIGFTDDPPAPTQEVLVPSLERLLVASAPFQELAMTTRRIYRWENRNETLKYLIGYYTLWFFNMLLPGCLTAIIYLILHRKVRTPTIEDLRKDIIRTEDMAETALSINEFIEKEGDEHWLDPLIEQVGPWALVQLSDLANLMEVLRNFYEWRVPHRTGISVGILFVGLLAVTITPVWLLVRATTFIIGVLFFGFFPVGSNFPDYRLLASPVRWVFWKIPSHAEWAIKSLQAEGARNREAESSTKPTADTVDLTPDPLGYRGVPNIDGKPVPAVETSEAGAVRDYGCYACKGGRFIINSVGVRYESSIGHKEQWSLRYDQIQRLEKSTRQVQKKIGQDSGDDLKIVGMDDREHFMQNMKDRDQAFSQIIGYSSVTWQVIW